jgi:hypothetical protein
MLPALARLVRRVRARGSIECGRVASAFGVPSEREVDEVVRVVHPGPLLSWPPPYADVKREDVEGMDVVAVQALERWAARTGRVVESSRGTPGVRAVR